MRRHFLSIARGLFNCNSFCLSSAGTSKLTKVDWVSDDEIDKMFTYIPNCIHMRSFYVENLQVLAHTYVYHNWLRKLIKILQVLANLTDTQAESLQNGTRLAEGFLRKTFDTDFSPIRINGHLNRLSATDAKQLNFITGEWEVNSTVRRYVIRGHITLRYITYWNILF